MLFAVDTTAAVVSFQLSGFRFLTAKALFNASFGANLRLCVYFFLPPMGI